MGHRSPGYEASVVSGRPLEAFRLGMCRLWLCGLAGYHQVSAAGGPVGPERAPPPISSSHDLRLIVTFLVVVVILISVLLFVLV